MPMLYTPQPRQFHYIPRTYDPELEDLERRKKIYAAQQSENEAKNEPAPAAAAEKESADGGADLEYFQKRVREIESRQRQRSAQLSWKDLFRRREKPQFHYTSRLGADGEAAQGQGQSYEKPAKRRRIGRRFDFDDPDYMRPVSAGKIILYVGLVLLLLVFIFF